VDPNDLPVRPPFSDLFPVRPTIREKVAMSMREDGYDASKPINVWRQEGIVVDGHTRRLAAIEAGVEVLICLRDFRDEDEALDYAIRSQRDRRNMTDAELLCLVEAVDRRRKAGRPSELASSQANSPSGKSSEQTADLIGTSRDKVEKARTINDYTDQTGDTEIKEAVKTGKLTINKACKRVKEKRNRNPRTDQERLEARKPILDRMNGEDGHHGNSNGNGHATDRPTRREADDEESAWLAKLPLWNKVQQARLRDDAMIYRAIKPCLNSMLDTVRETAGIYSPHLAPQLYAAVQRLASIPGPEHWQACPKCKGEGVLAGEGRCNRCNGGGYKIPGL
jgi:hypothetical protein